VDQVKWWEAIEFCNRLSEADGLPACYELDRGDRAVELCDESCEVEWLDPDGEGPLVPLDCEGYRLPTEAEWEFAARAGTVTLFHSGDSELHLRDCDGLNPDLDAIGWFLCNSGRESHAVAGKAPNPWGLYDASGNVYEWTWDTHASFWPGGPATDPTGPPESGNKVARGGYHSALGTWSRSAARISGQMSNRLRSVGLRPVRTVRRDGG